MHKLRICMNAIPLFHPTIHSQQWGLLELAHLGHLIPRFLLYTGTGLVLQTPSILSTPHLASFVGTICSALFENLHIMTIGVYQIFLIMSCPLQWKGTLMTMVQIVIVSGQQVYWTVGELCSWTLRGMKSSRGMLLSGDMEWRVGHRPGAAIIVILHFFLS